MNTLYQYSIKYDGEKTYLREYMGKGKRSSIISCIDASAESSPVVAANLLRDLAKWAIEQAEIIEEIELDIPIPNRDPDKTYGASIVEIDWGNMF